MADVIVVADPGVDDMVALVLLNQLVDQRSTKTLISTFGNQDAKVTGRNAEAFAAHMQAGWEYRAGATKPASGRIEAPWAETFHGPDGLWGELPPAGSAVARSNSESRCNNLISLGPLTEPHRILREGKLKRLTLMGGAFEVHGNETQWAEFNIAMDPVAASMLFEESQGAAVSVVPLDVIQHVNWSYEDISRIPEDYTTYRWIKRLLTAWFQNCDSSACMGFPLYDPLAVYLAYYPDAADWVRSGVAVIQYGSQRGRTKMSDTNPPCDIAMCISNPRSVAEAIFDLTFRLPPLREASGVT